MAISLRKGQGIQLENEDMSGKVKVTLMWKTPVDLDIHCKVKDGSREEHTYFGNRNGRYAKLDKDAGIGSTAGNNKETMVLEDFANVKESIFYVENFGKSNEDFSKYGAKLLINFSGKPVVVDVEGKNKGKYFVICAIKDGAMVNINEVTSKEPRLSDYEEGFLSEIVDKTGAVVSTVADAGKGLLRKVGGFLSRI